MLIHQLELQCTPIERELMRIALLVASDDGAFTDEQSVIVDDLIIRLTPRLVRV